MDQITSYGTCKDHGKIPPKDYKKIPVLFVFDVKFDLRRKARLVAGGHLTKPIFNDAPYTGIASIKSIRVSVFLAKLNGLDIRTADVGNAYLMALTGEKLYIIAGPEFGELEGHILIVFKALYGLRTSGARWDALSYHRVREAIAAEIIKFVHIDGDKNPADILTKPLPQAKWYPLMKPILHWVDKDNPIAN